MSDTSIPQAFAAALDGLVRQLRKDTSILAAILCGSLSHDTVWARSDIDLVLVTVDDRKVAAGDIPLYADGVNVHVLLVPRVEFRRTVEGALQGSWIHSFLAKGRLLYTHDPTIEDLFARLASRGRRDTAILKRQKFHDAIPAGLPDGTVVGHKTGNITKIHHDAAIVYGPRPYVLVVLVRGIQDQKVSGPLIASISREIWNGLSR